MAGCTAIYTIWLPVLQKLNRRNKKVISLCQLTRSKPWKMPSIDFFIFFDELKESYKSKYPKYKGVAMVDKNTNFFFHLS